MKTIIFLVLFTSALTLAQGVEVTISSDSAEYNQRFSFGRERFIKITTEFRNNTGQSIYLKTDPIFELNYFGEESNWGHCFRMYEYDRTDDSTFSYYQFNRFESFVKIEAGEEYSKTGYYSIGWLCRNAPPRGTWEFDIIYHSVLSREENYYLVNSRYTDFTNKEFVDAWTGELRSNTIKVKIY